MSKNTAKTTSNPPKKPQAKPNSPKGNDGAEEKKTKPNPKRKDPSPTNNGSKKLKGESGSAPPRTEEHDKNENTIHIRGMSYETEEHHLRDFFKDCGPIESVRIPTYVNRLKKKGYAFVKFATHEAAAKALQKNKESLLDRFLEIDLASSAPRSFQNPGIKPPGCKSVFVASLPVATTESDIKELFSHCGVITDVYMKKKKETFTGFCYINFDDEQAPENALKLNNQVFHGNHISVGYRKSQPKEHREKTKQTKQAKQGNKAGNGAASAAAPAAAAAAGDDDDSPLSAPSISAPADAGDDDVAVDAADAPSTPPSPAAATTGRGGFKARGGARGGKGGRGAGAGKGRGGAKARGGKKAAP